ncbi:hypothetical protein AB8615_12020 [Litorimonas sp. RW-G-Af-16]|uniref:hypothetical protein n=1 Tax=Litorimonas sp. RW-G-Af-16 TaxID=3241168 RepID=UPI003AAABAD8
MKNKHTIKGLKLFAFLFFALALICVIGGIVMAVTLDVPSDGDQMKVAAERLGKFISVLSGALYGLTFLFFGLVSRALAILVEARSNADNEIGSSHD